MNSPHAAGMMESMLSVSYEQYIIDDEILGMASKLLHGIDVDDDTLAFDAIVEVGPGGNFMMSPHTLKYLRTEFFEGNGISDRLSHQEWFAAGALDTMERAKRIVRDKLSQQPTRCISEDMDREIRSKFKIVSRN